MRTDHAVAGGTTWLFVPGDRPDRFAKAAGSGADQVILDLEDAVAPEAKAAARDAVATYLLSGRAWVRVNGAPTRWHAEDLRALATLPGVRGIVLPKADRDAVRAVAEELGRGIPLLALVETARGVVDAVALAEHPAVARLAFGSLDFAVDIDAAGDDLSVLLARSTLVVASRAAGLVGPIDGVSAELRDAESVGRAARRGRDLGFAGKLCIHPAQLDPVAAAFAPTPKEVAEATALLAAYDGSGPGAAAVDGRMVDRPVLDRARAILRRHAPDLHGGDARATP